MILSDQNSRKHPLSSASIRHEFLNNSDDILSAEKYQLFLLAKIDGCGNLGVSYDQILFKKEAGISNISFRYFL